MGKCNYIPCTFYKVDFVSILSFRILSERIIRSYLNAIPFRFDCYCIRIISFICYAAAPAFFLVQRYVGRAAYRPGLQFQVLTLLLTLVAEASDRSLQKADILDK